MLSLHLLLLDISTVYLARLRQVGVPMEQQGSKTTPEIGIDEIDHRCAAGIGFGYGGCRLLGAEWGSLQPGSGGYRASLQPTGSDVSKREIRVIPRSSVIAAAAGLCL